MTSILPPNLGELERDLEAALARIGEVPIPTATLWDPWSCPLAVLPFLAWAVSVDQWRSVWPESVKRQVVASSLDVHRIKGTRPAVEQGLRDLGLDAELVEWFEADPPQQPGTFTINLKTSIESQDDYDAMVERVQSTKNTRSWLTTVALQRRIDLGLTLSTATVHGIRTRMGPRPAVTAPARSDLLSGAARHESRSVTVRPQRFAVSVEIAERAWRAAFHESRHIILRG